MSAATSPFSVSANDVTSLHAIAARKTSGAYHRDAVACRDTVTRARDRARATRSSSASPIRASGAGDLRNAHPLGGRRPRRHRLGGGAHAKAEGDMRFAHGPSGAAHEPGAAKLTAIAHKTDTTLIFSQTSCARKSASSSQPRNDDWRQPRQFYASVRLDVRRIGQVKVGEDAHRQPHARQGREETSARLRSRKRVRDPLGHGIDHAADLLDLAIMPAWVDKSAHTNVSKESTSATAEKARRSAPRQPPR